MRPEEVQVLVVDDVNAIRVQLKDLLRTFGFKKVNVAAHGEEAKECLADASQTYHLILADWHMEPCDGIDLLKFVRAHPKYKTTPYIMVTAESTKENVVKAIQSGVDDYLIKPLTILQVQNKVYAVLFKKGIL